MRRRWVRGLLGRRFCRWNHTCQFLVGQTSGTLEAAAQFPKSFRAALVARFTMDPLQERCEFGGAPIVASTKDKVGRLLARRRVARRAAQASLEPPNGV